MKQILLSEGEILIEDVPQPVVGENEVLVKTHFSLISSGTELSGKKKSGSLLKQVVSKKENIEKGLSLLKKKGIKGTLETINDIKTQKRELGYSISGEVIQVGNKIIDIQVGDKVACAGAGKACHAEIVKVPRNLVVKIPKNVSLKNAASVTLGSIALQGVRRADLQLGEKVAVIGLGLLGQITVQLLKAAGCQVIGFDLDKSRVDHAITLGMDRGFSVASSNSIQETENFTDNKGVDAVIITAAAPNNTTLVQQAMHLVRKKGRVVIVGDVGLSFLRSPFYQKEADLLISCSYGPGRYDPNYEIKNIDYPFAYVRWTENRNMKSYLELISEGKVNFEDLVVKIFDFSQAKKAYQFLASSRSAKPAVVLQYVFNGKTVNKLSKIQTRTRKITDNKRIKVGLIGAGGFAKGMHLPNLAKLNQYYQIEAICDLTPINAKQTAEKYQARYCVTDYHKILEDDEIDLVFITAPHNIHAKISLEALHANKAVFCEKPMALHQKELNELVDKIRDSQLPYSVGFNRRFSPFIKKIKHAVEKRTSPLLVEYRMNVGFLPKNHWTQTEVGGGRNLGEACHIYDVFTFLTQAKTKSIHSFSLDVIGKYSKNDNFVTSIKFQDGSVCNLVYTAVGNKSFPKEEMTVFFDQKMICVSDYLRMEGGGINLKDTLKKPDKGHLQELKEFAQAFENNMLSIPLWQLEQATAISLEVEKQIYQ